MGKKDDALMERQKARFVEGARKNGIPDGKITEIFDLMRQFGGYGFNKSHSAAYALVSYQTAYLKTHYPVEYYSALMTSESGDTAKIIRYIAHCRGKGIPILPPDANESRYAFFPVGKAIRFGLSAIKGLGASAVEAILEARSEKPFESVRDFLFRVDLRKVNKRAVESLVKSGALDSLDPDRGRVFNDLSSLLDEAQAEVRRRESGQFALFAGPAEEKPAGKRDGKAAHTAPAWSRTERLAFEKEALGFYITGHPLDSWAAEIALYANVTTARLAHLKTGYEVRIGGIVTGLRERTTRKGEKMATLTLEDLEGTVAVTVFPNQLAEFRDILSSADPIFLLGHVKAEEQGVGIIADEMFRMESVRDRLSRSVHFQVLLDRMNDADVAELRKTILRHAGDKKGFLHLVRPGDYEAIIALPDGVGVAPSLELAHALRGRFGYDVLRLH
jgi:DNA polymerase-3 subunit alpha